MFGLGQKRLYQIGNADDLYFIVPKTNLVHSFQPKKNLKIDDSFIFNGFSRLNGNEKDTWGANEMSISFDITKSDTNLNYKIFNLNYLNRLCDTGMQMFFFYEYDQNEDLKWYYTYGYITSPTEQKIENNGDGGLDTENLRVGFTAFLQPFFYECSTEIKYLNTSTFTTSTINWGSTTWGGSIWQPNNSQYALISSITNLETKKSYFTGCNSKFPVWLLDRFFQRKNQTVGTYLINQTLTTADITETYTGTGLQNTTADNLVYRIEITPLDYLQSIVIENLDNDSGFKFTWQNPIVSSNSIVFNSYKGKFYDLTTGDLIPYTSINIEPLRNRDLYFSALMFNRSANTHSFPTKELIRLQRTAGTNSTIKIDVLQTFR
jgi:hypothetical protein